MTDANIIRVEHDADNPYFVANRFFANDQRLSWEARGMMAYFLSQRSDWKIWPNHLIKQAPDSGRDKVYRILKELELAGYISRTQPRADAGRVGGVITKVTETPAHRDMFDRSGLKRVRPRTDNPEADTPHTDLPDTANPHHNKYSLKTSNNHHPTPEPTSPTVPDRPVAPVGAGGGGGRDRKPETTDPALREADAYLRDVCDVKAPARRRQHLADGWTKPTLEVAWGQWQRQNSERRAKGQTPLAGGAFSDSLIGRSPQPVTAPVTKPVDPMIARYREWQSWDIDKRNEEDRKYRRQLLEWKSQQPHMAA